VNFNLLWAGAVADELVRAGARVKISILPRDAR